MFNRILFATTVCSMITSIVKFHIFLHCVRSEAAIRCLFSFSLCEEKLNRKCVSNASPNTLH
ncbi:hypothetical protein Fmac_005502 [Flemingia macrophylla]|uniref:Secreted protein n=1 Tax=Flemingia macrophylla TaxID=520843 RepID=A0ABD1N7Y8_9FABA